MVDEKLDANNRNLTFDNFVKPATLEDRVKTAMESVDDLFPNSLSHGHLIQPDGAP